MEAVTFHDQSAGMTVVWLADSRTSPADRSNSPGSPRRRTRQILKLKWNKRLR